MHPRDVRLSPSQLCTRLRMRWSSTYRGNGVFGTETGIPPVRRRTRVTRLSMYVLL